MRSFNLIGPPYMFHHLVTDLAHCYNIRLDLRYIDVITELNLKQLQRMTTLTITAINNTMLILKEIPKSLEIL